MAPNAFTVNVRVTVVLLPAASRAATNRVWLPTSSDPNGRAVSNAPVVLSKATLWMVPLSKR